MVKLVRRATMADPMKNRIGTGAGNSFTWGAKTVTVLATMLQREMAYALCLKGNIWSFPKLAE